MNKKMMTVLGATLVPGTALAVTLVALAASSHDVPKATIEGSSASDGTTVVDPSMGETFKPVSTTTSKMAARLISPDKAYRKAQNGATSLPPGASVQLGRLTLPLGARAPGQYTAKDQLVYAYTWAQCGPNVTPVTTNGTPSATPTDPASCTAWLFVDASTGQMVDQTWTE